MKNKFVMTPSNNRQFVRDRLDDYLYASMSLARYDVLEEDCKNGILPEGSEERQAYENFKEAYERILDPQYSANYDELMELHRILMKGLMDEYKNQLTPEQILELNAMIDQPAKANTEIALDVMIHILGKRLFSDGDVRVALMFANKIMIDNGCGFITVLPKQRDMFRSFLKVFNETGNGKEFKDWLYTSCIRGKQNYDY